MLVSQSLGNDNSPEILMTKRVLSTLPQIPKVIRSQLEGKSDGIKCVSETLTKMTQHLL